MKKLIKCKTCGFIMEEGKLKDKCPACGVPAKMFEPYTSDISEKRASILNAHLHPVIVHAPQASAFFLLAFVLIFIFNVPFKNDLLSTIKILSFLLPIVVLGAFGSGLLDGKTRFRKVTTPILVQKITLGILFFVFSSVMLVLAFFFDLNTILVWTLFLLCNLICFVMSMKLGLLGSSLLNARFRG